jgi:hypothetical protein
MASKNSDHSNKSKIACITEQSKANEVAQAGLRPVEITGVAPTKISAAMVFPLRTWDHRP